MVVSDGASTTTSSVITVVVGDVLENTPPVAVNDSFAAIEDDRNPATTDDVSPVVGNILSNDSDVDVTNGVPGQSLRVSAIRAGDLAAGGATTTVAGPTTIAGQFGALTVDGLGNVSYVLDPSTDSLNTGDTRREVFTYTLVDNTGGSSQAELVYNIEGRTDALAVDAVDDFATRLVTTADFIQDGINSFPGIVLSTNDQPSSPSRQVEVIAVTFTMTKRDDPRNGSEILIKFLAPLKVSPPAMGLQV
ncbi:VCBS domain-containing protein [Hankyongella ginsenosidimutans]|uniref:VCBS domain-containing protein n=1 Tax=Hankyongella ginsenosidimutans TaxID=1763828 RepID=UPI001CA31386|nr:VCBS domain-containing protein [Hankyongella ginsenosidimutans]